jgi:hypothetical protein
MLSATRLIKETRFPHQIRQLVFELKQFAYSWWLGFSDALRFKNVYHVLSRDPQLRSLIFKCFLLNGIIFVGSHLLFSNVIQPALSYFLSFIETDNVYWQLIGTGFRQFFWIAYLVSLCKSAFLLCVDSRVRTVFHNSVSFFVYFIHTNRYFGLCHCMQSAFCLVEFGMMRLVNDSITIIIGQ